MTKEERIAYNKAYKEANRERQKVYDKKYREGLKDNKRLKAENFTKSLINEHVKNK